MIGTRMTSAVTVGREVRFRDRADARQRCAAGASSAWAGCIWPRSSGSSWPRTGRCWVQVLSLLDGRVVNRGVARYQQLWGQHLDPQGPRTYPPDVIALKVRTRQSRIEIAEAARTRVYRGRNQPAVERSTHQVEDYIHQTLEFDVEQAVPVRVEKLGAVYTSRDRAISEPLTNAGQKRRALSDVRRGARGPRARMERAMGGVRSAAAGRRARAVPASAACFARSANVLTPDTAPRRRRSSLRGLTARPIRGHVFWDELYVYPFLNFRLPEITRRF